MGVALLFVAGDFLDKLPYSVKSGGWIFVPQRTVCVLLVARTVMLYGAQINIWHLDSHVLIYEIVGKIWLAINSRISLILFFYIDIFIKFIIYFVLGWKWKSLTLCDLIDYTVHTVHGILQARILEWVAVPFSRGSSQPRDQTQVSHIAGGFFISWATREALNLFFRKWSESKKKSKMICRNGKYCEGGKVGAWDVVGSIKAPQRCLGPNPQNLWVCYLL